MNSFDENDKTENLKLRLHKAIAYFNEKSWYLAHDAFEEVWHESIGPERSIIQAFLQISVAELHLEGDNINGAIILYGEAIGRLSINQIHEIDLDIVKLLDCVKSRLNLLRVEGKIDTDYPSPYIKFK